MARKNKKGGIEVNGGSTADDVEMSGNPTLAKNLPAAQIANGMDDPMADPTDAGAEEDEEELFEPDLSDSELGDEDDEEASNISADEEEAEFDDENEDEDADMDGGAPLTTRESLSPSAVPLIGVNSAGGRTETTITAITDGTASIIENAIPASLHVEKPIPYTFDAGHLLVNDGNPLPATNEGNRESIYTSVARDAAQSLLNHLLTTCPIHTLSTTSTSTSGVEMTLPKPTYLLPREKRVPAPKSQTTWEKFAAKKGIGKNKRNDAVQGRSGKYEYDKETGEFVPKYGYKGANKKGEGDWLVEVDEKAENKAMEKDGTSGGLNPRNVSRAERVKNVKRNARAQKTNEFKARKNGAA